MSDLLDKISSGVGNAKKSFLGPSYSYWENVKQPAQMNMTPGFSLGTLANNVDGLISYVEILVSGKSNASKTGKPLGNKFFLKTAGKCANTNIVKWKAERDEDMRWKEAYNNVETKLENKEITEEQAATLQNALDAEKKDREGKREQNKKMVDRYIYINNVPDGTIPFIANGANGNTFQDFKGLIPGAIGNLSALNPGALFTAFTMGSSPDCSEISLQTINENNTRGMEKHHLALVDVVDMNPCLFQDKTNPASGAVCQESFTKMNNTDNSENDNTGSYSSSYGSGTGSEISPKPTREPAHKMLVSENGESIGLYETGSLAGSTGVAYQTTHRSPLSFNIANNKASSMTSDLEYSKFEMPNIGEEGEERTLNSNGVLKDHETRSSSFFKTKINELFGHDGNAPQSTDNSGDDGESVYSSLLFKLSQLINSVGDSQTPNKQLPNTDLSQINGGLAFQVYYASISFILLYFMYKMLYSTKRK